MSADWSKPAVTDSYDNVITYINNRLNDVAQQFKSSVVTATNIPTNTVRWNDTSSLWQTWNGTSWNALTATFAINVATANTATSATSATSANTATLATNAGNVTVTNDTSSNGTFYPTFVGATSGNQAVKLSSTKMTYQPSTGLFAVANLTVTNTITASITGLAGTATKWATARTLTANGDVTGTSVAFDGSANTSWTFTLPNVNGNVGTFNNLTVNAKGQVTAGSNVAYLTTNQTITLSGVITGSGGTSIVTSFASSTGTGAVVLANQPTFAATGANGGRANWANGSGGGSGFSIDHVYVSGDRIRFYQNSGNNNGAFMQLSNCAAGVATELIHSTNYTNYAPTKTGGGASGTWGISVTGSAGSVANGVVTTGNYSNPAWIYSLAATKITGNVAQATNAITAATANGPTSIIESTTNTTSGSSIKLCDFNSAARHVDVLLNSVSTNGTSALILTFNYGGGLITGVCTVISATPTDALWAVPAGGGVAATITGAVVAAGTYGGIVRMTRLTSSNPYIWAFQSNVWRIDSALQHVSSGFISTTIANPEFYIGTIGGVNTFDSGSVVVNQHKF